jgi:hypothetical protein
MAVLPADVSILITRIFNCKVLFHSSATPFCVFRGEVSGQSCFQEASGVEQLVLVLYSELNAGRF